MKKLAFVFFYLVILFSCKKDTILFDDTFIQFTTASSDHVIHYGIGNTDTIFAELSIIGSPFSDDQSLLVILDSVASALVEQGYIQIQESINFPAHISSVKVPIVFDNTKIEEAYRNSFKLQLKDESFVASNYNSFQITFYKQKLIDVFSGDFLCRETLYDNEFEVFILNTVPVSDTLMIKNFWDFTDSDTNILVILEQNNSNKLFIPEQTFIDQSGLELIVVGEGTYEPSGTFVIDYELRDFNDKLFEKGSQEYIPN